MSRRREPEVISPDKKKQSLTLQVLLVDQTTAATLNSSRGEEEFSEKRFDPKYVLLLSAARKQES